MRKREKKAELLAPAGSMASVIAAVNAGADAIYMGGRQFGARAYAASAVASEEDMLAEAIDYCHLFHVRLYMTLNILVKESEFPGLCDYVGKYYALGLDGVIVQDLGVVSLIQKTFPELEIHASTQMALSGVGSAKLAEKLGMCRAVLARELCLREIAEIHQNSSVELEVFVHGAMCYSYSGACFMSSLLGGRSGNRGRCAGTCRLCYESQGKRGFFLSMKDMNTVELLPELLHAGSYSFKIEGRMKSPLYTAAVVSVYRKYLDLALSGGEYKTEQRDLQLLREVYDRGGFTDYLSRHNGRDMIAVQEKRFRVPDSLMLRKVTEKYLKQDRKIPLRLKAFLDEEKHLVLRAGEKVMPLPAYRYTAYGMAVQEESEARRKEASLSLEGFVTEVRSPEPAAIAENRGTAPEDIEKQLRKSGNTVFSVAECEIAVPKGCFFPVSLLNALRRELLQKCRTALLSDCHRGGKIR